VTKQYLVLNAGSSSLKFAVYEGGAARARGTVEAVGANSRFSVRTGAESIAHDGGAFSHDAALTQLLDWLRCEGHLADVAGAGHRVVHGGTDFAAPVVVDANVRRRLEAYVPMAPQHQPYNLAAIDAVAHVFPNLPQVACFDTSFHETQPPVATAFPLPRTLSDAGVRRYGFHGLSYDYIASVLPQHLGARADGRVVVAHLGHGASMCAMHARRSTATTMGFSALDGLMMGTRSGAIDPGVVLYLLEQKGMSAAVVSRLLYDESGLLGVSGESDDMRTLLASTSPHAREAVELFVYRIARELGSLAAALGGLNALVFTAGIGEGSAEIRARVCAQAAWLGVELDAAANARGGPLISAAASGVAALALHTDEEAIIARDCQTLLG
jgi:acetate kinase